MTYVAAEARQELLDEIARAIGEIGTALAALGAAYEQLDEAAGDRLEAALFGPVQKAYGRAKRLHAAFAQRSNLPERTWADATPGAPPSAGVRGFLEHAVDAAREADATLADLQDSMRLVEIGDAPLRADVAEVRGLLGSVEADAEGFVRTFGR